MGFAPRVQIRYYIKKACYVQQMHEYDLCISIWES